MATTVSVPVSRGESLTSSHSSRRKRSRSEFDSENLDVPASGVEDDGQPRKRARTVSVSVSKSSSLLGSVQPQIDDTHSVTSVSSTESRKRRFSQTDQVNSEDVLRERSLNKKMKTLHHS